MWVIILSIIIGIIFLLLVGLFIGLSIIYWWVFYTPHKGQDNDFFFGDLDYQGHLEEAKELISRLSSMESEPVSIKSYDKLKLTGHLYKANNNLNKVAIMCHGYRGTPRRDFSGGAIEMMELGYTVLLIDERGHGGSDGHTITFGIKEQLDAIRWIEYVKSMYGDSVSIVLVGISMGASTVLFASNKIDSDIKIIADCPYNSPKDIINNTIKKLGMSPKIYFPFVNLTSLIFAHTGLLKEDAIKSVKESNNKILIIHGLSDTVVPYQLSEKIYLENKDKVRYETFPNAEHGISYLLDRERYRKIIREFLEE